MADAGLKLAVEGEKEFKSAINDINAEMKNLQSEMKLATSAFDENDASQKSLKDQSRILSDQIGKQTEKIDKMNAALQEAESAFGKNDKRTQEWKRKINLANAELNGMKKSLDKTDGQITKFSDRLKSGAKAAATFGKGVLTAGKNAASFTAGKAVSAIKGMSAAFLGVATAAGTAAASTITAGAEIDKMAKQSHVSAETYQEWAFVLGQSGLEAEKIKDGMDSLVPKIAEAKAGGEEAVAMFEKLDISQQELQTSSPEALFEATVRGLQKMRDGTEKAAIADELLGGAGSELAPILSMSALEVKRMKDQAHDLGAVMNDETIAAAKESAKQFGILKASFTGIKNKVATDFLPGINLMLGGFNDLIAGQEGAEEKIDQGIEQIMGNLKSGIRKAPEIVKKVFPALIETIIKEGPSLVLEIVKATMEIGKTIIDTIIDFAPEIMEAGKDLIKGLWDGIKDMAGWIKEKISGFTSGIVDNVKEFFGIHSPSTVFAELGGYMAEGLGLGFEKEMGSVAGKMNRAVPQNFSIGGMYSGIARPVDQPLQVVINLGGTEVGRKLVDITDAERMRRGGIQVDPISG